MNIDFSSMRITIVVAPVDMRMGYRTLASRARAVLDLDVDAGGELVAFISRSRGICKLIWADEYGSALLTRRLHTGRFEQFLCRKEGPATLDFSVDDLNSFLDGDPVFVRRKYLLG